MQAIFMGIPYVLTEATYEDENDRQPSTSSLRPTPESRGLGLDSGLSRNDIMRAQNKTQV